MATEMEFTVPAAAFPLGSIFTTAPDATVELERLVPHDRLSMPYFWVRGADTDAIETEFEHHAGVRDIQLVDSVDDEYLLRAKWDREYDGLLGALSAANLTVLSGVGTNDGWRFEVRGDDADAIAAFRTHTRETGISIDISMVHALLPIQGDSFELTETQREALVLAYERGYFDTPRDSTLEDIAAELDITQQSLSARLRRGHRRLIGEALATNSSGASTRHR